VSAPADQIEEQAPGSTRAMIAVTMGDPLGIGPEVAVKAVTDRQLREAARFVLVGDLGVFEGAARQAGVDANLVETSGIGAAAHASEKAVPVLPVKTDVSRPIRWAPGPTKWGGDLSVRCILKAIELAIEGTVRALVTAPISKEAIQSAGHPWPGHTEMLGDRTGAHPVMMMMGGGLRVALVTTHVAIAKLPKAITKQRVLNTIRIVHRSLVARFGVSDPTVGVCGLNPHAGESGRFGDEEQVHVAPAVESAKAEGINCIGPLPADVLFHQAHRGTYDAVVAMYHDQANIPVKMLAFETGVNVTLGLPIIRTSPDHGTAYDIAWTGRANPSSMCEAVKVAIGMSEVQ